MKVAAAAIKEDGYLEYTFEGKDTIKISKVSVNIPDDLLNVHLLARNAIKLQLFVVDCH